MTKRLYVGNLPFNTDETQVREMFETDGRKVANVQIIMDRMTGRSRGFGFVEFDSEQDAETAVQSMNGKDLNGRALVVNEAREQTRTDSGGPSRGGFGGPSRDRGARGGFGGNGNGSGRDRGNRSRY